MDLSNLAPVETARMQVVHPVTGEAVLDEKGKEFFIEGVGTDSDIYRKQIQKSIKDAQRRKGNIGVEGSELRGAELLVKCVSDCHLILNGKKVEKDNLVKVFLEFKWLREQWESFISDRANFIKD